jgi:hypothetical protein
MSRNEIMTPAEFRAAHLAGMSEKQLQAAVVALARRLGWLCFHAHDSRHSAAGYPDLTLCRDRVVFAELKREGGKLTTAQEEWRDWLLLAGQEWHLWTPSCWPDIEQALRLDIRGSRKPPQPAADGGEERAAGEEDGK